MSKRSVLKHEPDTGSRNGRAGKGGVHAPAGNAVDERLRKQHEALKQLVASWRDEDASEQRETFEYLREALDADRPSYRKLFH